MVNYGKVYGKVYGKIPATQQLNIGNMELLGEFKWLTRRRTLVPLDCNVCCTTDWAGALWETQALEEPSNHGPLMVDDYLWLMVRKYLSGWWLTYPSEK